jgi:hypothetical protein
MLRIVKACKPGVYIRRRIYTNRRWVGVALQIPAKPPQAIKRYTLHDSTGQKHRISYDPTRRNDLE